MNTNTLPQFTVATSPARTRREQYNDGFAQYSDDVRTGCYCTAEELAAMTPDERRGYRDAISAADYADFMQWREVRNSFGDATFADLMKGFDL